MHTLSLPIPLICLPWLPPSLRTSLLVATGGQPGLDILAAFPEDVRVYAATPEVANWRRICAPCRWAMVGRRASCYVSRQRWFSDGLWLARRIWANVPVGLEDDFPLGALLRACRQRFWSTAPTPAPGWWPSTANQLDRLIASLADGAGRQPGAPQVARDAGRPPQAFTDAVRRIQRYIRGGDVFQVNVSRQVGCDAGAGLEPGRGVCRAAAGQSGAVFRVAAIGRACGWSACRRSGWCGWWMAGGHRPIAGTHPRSRPTRRRRRPATTPDRQRQRTRRGISC